MVEEAEESGEEKATVKQEEATAMPLSLSELTGNVDVFTLILSFYCLFFYLERS